jgi:hypothetical protein
MKIEEISRQLTVLRRQVRIHFLRNVLQLSVQFQFALGRCIATVAN